MMYRMRKGVVLVALVASLYSVDLSIGQMSSQETDAEARRNNYEACLNGYSCNSSMLSADEQESVAIAAHRRNYEACLNGYSCDASMLTANEQASVTVEAHKRNYQSCLNGYACDASMLGTNEQAMVTVEAHKRNYQSCLNGYSCDASMLTANEQASVTIEAHKRNYQSCLNGYSCDASMLTANEQAMVAVEAHKRNYQSCLNGYSSCDRSLIDKAGAGVQPTDSAQASERLDYFKGDWSVRGEIYANPLGSGGKFTGTHRNNWRSDTSSLVSQWDEQHSYGRDIGEGAYQYDTEQNVYIYHGVSNTGETEDATGTVNGNIWVWMSNPKSEDGEVLQTRFTETEVSPISYTFKLERVQTQTGTWIKIMEGEASKLK